MKRLFSSRHSFSSTPTVTSMPASRNFCMPRPFTLAKGSTHPTTTRLTPLLTIRSAHGGVRAVMRAWLEAHIHGRLAEQCPILRLHRRKGVHFGVAFAASYMISLANYAAVFAHNHSPHHRIGPCRKLSAACQLKAPAHIHFVFFSLFHAANILQVKRETEIYRRKILPLLHS